MHLPLQTLITQLPQQTSIIVRSQVLISIDPTNNIVQNLLKLPLLDQLRQLTQNKLKILLNLKLSHQASLRLSHRILMVLQVIHQTLQLVQIFSIKLNQLALYYTLDPLKQRIYPLSPKKYRICVAKER